MTNNPNQLTIENSVLGAFYTAHNEEFVRHG